MTDIAGEGKLEVFMEPHPYIILRYIELRYTDIAKSDDNQGLFMPTQIRPGLFIDGSTRLISIGEGQ